MTGEGAYGETAFAEEVEAESFAWIEMAGLAGDTQVNGPAFYTDMDGNLISSPGDLVPALAVELSSRSDPGSLDGADLVDTFGRSFYDEANDTGSATIAYANTDTAAAAALVEDMLVTYSVWGVRAFTQLVESLHRVTAADGEDYDQVTVVIGRGHLCIGDEACLYPSRGTGILPIEEDRTFNWSTPTPVYDDSGWGYANQICTVAVAQSIWPYQPSFEGWPVLGLGAGVIWAHGTDHTDAPAGFCYFRKDVTVGLDTFYLLYGAADNEGDLYLDGQLVLHLNDFLGAFTYSVFMTAGTHTIAIVCENWEWNTTANPAGLAFALFTQDAAGEPATLIAKSDETWKIVPYPPGPPGMLVGKVLRLTLDEAWARAELLDIVPMFSETEDSAGNPWPEVVDIATKVGTSYLTFWIELTASYIDVWMKPGTLELHAWNRGTRPAPGDVILHAPTDDTDPESGNIYEQSHTLLT